VLKTFSNKLKKNIQKSFSVKFKTHEKSIKTASSSITDLTAPAYCAYRVARSEGAIIGSSRRKP